MRHLAKQRKGRTISGILLGKFVAGVLACTLLFFPMPFSASAETRERFSIHAVPAFSDIPVTGVIWESPEPTLPTALSGTSAQSALLMNANTGEILFRQNDSARLPMASTTKIMTALVAVESLPLDTPVTVTEEAVGVEGSSIYLTEGETLTLEALLYALMMESANDAAVAIAVAVSGSVEAFAEKMNQRAASLGLTDTHFTNPHGLDHAEHYTTARELALIAREALKHETLVSIMSTQRKTIPHEGTGGVRLMLNHNKLLRTYEGAIGVKTGFTKKSGRCLVSAARRGEVTLIAVTIKASNDWRDHTAMLDYGFSLYDTVELCPEGAFEAPLWVVGGTGEYVMVKNHQTLVMALPKDHGDIRCVVELPRFVYAPIASGDEVGRLVYYESAPDGSWHYLGEVPLYAQHGVQAEVYKKSLLDKISELFGF